MTIRRLLTTALFTASLTCAMPLRAQTAVEGGSPSSLLSPAQAFASLAGEWAGALQYRDYQSNALQEIPMATSVEALADGVTLIQRSRFTDPGVQVYITSITLVSGDTVQSTSARKGRTMEIAQQSAAVSQAQDAEHWTMVLSGPGMDDDRPAEIRETLTRNGDAYTSVKEVDYSDDAVTQFEYRNSVRLNWVSAAKP